MSFFSELYKTDKPVKRLLGSEDWVGHLDFQFFDGDITKLRIDTIPFYENPQIGESQESNYATMSPIGRAGNLYAYTGAQSRNIDITFNIRLPHMTQIVNHYQSSRGTESNTTLDKIKDILEGSKNLVLGSLKDKASTKVGLGSGDASWYDTKHLEVLKQEDESSFNLLQKLALLNPMYNPGSDGTKARRDMINKLARDINLIRTSVLNNAEKPQFGPPIVRLNFGILYQDVPCICKGFRLNILEEGFDDTTLLPRGIKVNMQLAEARNLGIHDKSKEVSRDSLAGWEVRFNTDQTPTTDPGAPGTQWTPTP